MLYVFGQGRLDSGLVSIRNRPHQGAGGPNKWVAMRLTTLQSVSLNLSDYALHLQFLRRSATNSNTPQRLDQDF